MDDNQKSHQIKSTKENLMSQKDIKLVIIVFVGDLIICTEANINK